MPGQVVVASLGAIPLLTLWNFSASKCWAFRQSSEPAIAAKSMGRPVRQAYTSASNAAGSRWPRWSCGNDLLKLAHPSGYFTSSSLASGGWKWKCLQCLARSTRSAYAVLRRLRRCFRGACVPSGGLRRNSVPSWASGRQMSAPSPGRRWFRGAARCRSRPARRSSSRSPGSLEECAPADGRSRLAVAPLRVLILRPFGRLR